MLRVKKSESLKQVHELYKKNAAGTGLDYIGELYQSDGQGGLEHIFSAGYDTTITGTSPLTLQDARAKNTTWEIDGQSSQDGTPTPTTPVDVNGCGNEKIRPNQQFNIAARTTATTIWGCTMTPNLTDGSIHLTGTGTITDFANSSGLSQWYPDGSMIAGHVYYVDMRGLEVGSMSPISIRPDGASRGFWTDPIIFTRGSAGNFVFSWNIVKDRVYDTTFKPQIIDLTLLYGAGNEPTTVAEFKQRLGVDEIPIYSYSATNIPYYEVPILQANNCGMVDLGTLNWNRINPQGTTFPKGWFQVTLTDKQPGTIDNFYLDGYINEVSGQDKKIWGNSINSLINITDYRFTDAALFKSAMSGKYLYYQRTTDTTWNTPATTNITLPAPLQKIGTYKDSIESNGTLTRGIGVKVFDGTESWSISSGNLFYSPISDALPEGLRSDKLICSHFKANTSSDVGNCFKVGINFNCVLDTELYPDVTTWKVWLAAQYAAGTPVIVYYPLATSTETTIETPTISTNKGTNIISVETNVKPSNVDVTYRKKYKATFLKCGPNLKCGNDIICGYQ